MENKSNIDAAALSLAKDPRELRELPSNNALHILTPEVTMERLADDVPMLAQDPTRLKARTLKVEPAAMASKMEAAPPNLPKLRTLKLEPKLTLEITLNRYTLPARTCPSTLRLLPACSTLRTLNELPTPRMACTSEICPPQKILLLRDTELPSTTPSRTLKLPPCRAAALAENEELRVNMSSTLT
jgi:hypothetical protein